MCGLDSNSSEYDAVTGSREHGTGFQRSIKGGKFLDHWVCSRFLNKKSAACGQVIGWTSELLYFNDIK